MSPTKSLTALLLLALAACSADAAEDVAEDTADLSGPATEGATLKTTTRLNLRESASMAAKVIVTIPYDKPVTVLEAAPQGGFYHVDYNGQPGWASGLYLVESDATEAPAADEETPVEPDASTFNGRKYAGVTMLWQGNWDFLMQCDSYSRRNGSVLFYCGAAESRSFVDDEAWVAMPSGSMNRRMCNTKARVCKGDSCIVAKVVERSVTGSRWEGSTAVLSALGVSTGFKGCTSSHGTATGVTITLE